MLAMLDADGVWERESQKEEVEMNDAFAAASSKRASPARGVYLHPRESHMAPFHRKRRRPCPRARRSARAWLGDIAPWPA